MADKASLRRLYTEKRKLLTTPESARLSEKILARFSNLKSLPDLKNLHIFYPITGKKEINTLLIADWLRQTYPHIKLILPRTHFKTLSMRHFVWTRDTALAINEWGITEPEDGVEVSAVEIDAVLMPLLAFDKQGNRIGYGKGFYDRFLTQCRTDALKIGLSYFEPEEGFEEIDPFDVPMNFCITPEKIWSFDKH